MLALVEAVDTWDPAACPFSIHFSRRASRHVRRAALSARMPVELPRDFVERRASLWPALPHGADALHALGAETSDAAFVGADSPPDDGEGLDPELIALFATLTPAEREVVEARAGLLYGGPQTTPTIAGRLRLLPRVVEKVHARAMEKLRYRARAAFAEC